MFYDALAATIENAGRSQLDECSRQVSRALGGANLTDDQASRLYGLIDVRRGPGQGRSLAASAPAIAPRYYIQRSPEQRSPDRRASFLRRRMLAATGPLPAHLAVSFTRGEIAALKIVADEFLARGACDLSKNEIGARAGVSKTVVKRALKLAEVQLSMISVLRRPRSGRKHLTSIIKIIRAEWLTWLDKGNRRAFAIKVCNQAKPVFSKVRGKDLDPPRAQDFKKAESDRVDKTVEKGNRSVASRDAL